MQIKYARARNFLSIGNDPVEIDFTTLGRIVSVVGRNLDRGDGASNGSGKSTLFEILVYGLYGKLIKRLSHKEAINNKTKKGLEIEVRWDDYRVVRTRKPDGLRLWKGDEEITRGGIPATQEEIERAIGLTYHAFINVACFGQHNQNAFLSCDPATKRQIVENLLALDRYNDFCKKAKDKRKAAEGEIALLVREYELHHRATDTAAKRIEQVAAQRAGWERGRQAEVAALAARIESLRAELAESDAGQMAARFDAAQNELVEVMSRATALQAGLERLTAGSDEARATLARMQEQRHALLLSRQTAQAAVTGADAKITELDREVARFTALPTGSECPTCRGRVDAKNCAGVIAHTQKRITLLRAEREAQTQGLAAVEAELATVESGLERVRAAVETAETKRKLIAQKLRELDARSVELRAVPPAHADAAGLALQGQITALSAQMEERKAPADDPFADMAAQAAADLADARSRADEVKGRIKVLEGQLPYIDYWVKAFGDQGIRKFVIDGCVPALNDRINYWLQFLIENKITLNFDNELEETIQSNPPDGDPFVYNALSGGEHNRIDLAISQAFAYLMMMSSGTCPSIVVLDEVATNVDRPGVHCLFAMISELSRDRQVFVISHDPDLQQLLQGADTLVVERQNGFSRLARN